MNHHYHNAMFLLEDQNSPLDLRYLWIKKFNKQCIETQRTFRMQHSRNFIRHFPITMSVFLENAHR